MHNHKIENGYYHIPISGAGTVRVPLKFIKVITPVYDENETLRGGLGKPKYTFDVWIYPSFAHSHGIALRHIERTGFLYSTLPPTTDINIAHKIHNELSIWHGFSEELNYGIYTR
jgi:hypothetical protein